MTGCQGLPEQGGVQCRAKEVSVVRLACALATLHSNMGENNDENGLL